MLARARAGPRRARRLLARRGWTSHSLEPWVWKTKTSWLSLCTAKPCEPGRRQVGVGLAGVAQRELELGDEPGQRRPVAVQPLEHDGGAALEQVDHLARVDQAGQRLAGQGGAAAGVAPKPGSTEPSLARRTAGVRIAVDVSSWSTSSKESSPTRSAGSAWCT